MNRIHIVATLAALTIAPLTVLPVPATAQAADPSVIVIDGDTLIINGEKIRIQGIDTPEKGEACHDEATKYLRDLVENGTVRVTSRDGKDRYGRTVASVSVGGADVGMKMIRAGYAIARYDSGDDYGSHPNEDRYHAAQRSTSCTGPVPVEGQTVPADLVQPEQGQTEPPFWTWAALGALAAESGLDIASFHSDDDDSNFALAATAAWIAARRDRAVVGRADAATKQSAADKAAAEAAWYAAAAENERIAAAEKAAAEAAWYAAAEANERAEAERAAAEQAERERAEREGANANRPDPPATVAAATVAWWSSQQRQPLRRRWAADPCRDSGVSPWRLPARRLHLTSEVQD